MLDQEDDTELDDDWLTDYEQLPNFSKVRQKIVGKVKGSELPSVQRTQSYEEELVVRVRVPSRTERPPVIEPGTKGSHAIIGQAQNEGSRDSQ